MPDDSTVLPDAMPANWVDRFAPARLRPWLKLGRVDRPTGIGLLMAPGWQGIALAGAMQGRWPDVSLLALFAVGAVLMRAAGCAFNDIVDRDVDGRVARTAARPIASGQISIRGAWVFLVGCALISFLILLSLNRLSIVLGFASLVLVAAYPFMKRITWWPQAWLGLTFNWGALMGFAAAGGGMTLPLAALLLYLSGVFWTLGYDTIYAVQDLEDDALVGVKSSARRLGQATPYGVSAFYGVSVLLALGVGLTGRLAPMFYVLAAAFGVQLAWQAARVRLDDPIRALSLFKSNTLAGLILCAALVAGSWRG